MNKDTLLIMTTLTPTNIGSLLISKSHYLPNECSAILVRLYSYIHVYQTQVRYLLSATSYP